MVNLILSSVLVAHRSASSAEQRRAVPCGAVPYLRCGAVLYFLFRAFQVSYDEVSSSSTEVHHTRFCTYYIVESQQYMLPAQLSSAMAQIRAAQRRAVLCGAVPCPAVRCRAAPYGAVPRRAARCFAVLCRAACCALLDSCFVHARSHSTKYHPAVPRYTAPGLYVLPVHCWITLNTPSSAQL